jgi:hypothetical protein
MFKELIMYKVEIDISVWGGDEKITIETSDFEKVQILQEFIEAQKDLGWTSHFMVFEDHEEEDEEEEEEDEPKTISTLIFTSKSF